MAISEQLQISLYQLTLLLNGLDHLLLEFLHNALESLSAFAAMLVEEGWRAKSISDQGLASYVAVIA
jgi:hypothetical protein